MRIVIVCSSYNKYVHDVCREVQRCGYNVDAMLVGSKIQRILFKIDSIKRVYKKHGVLEVIRRLHQKDKLSMSIQYTGLGDIAMEMNSEVNYFDDVNEGGILSYLAANKESQIVILAGSGIVDKAFLNCAGPNCINGHPSMLPGYRGVDVVDWALNDGAPLGVSSHLVTPIVDGGNVLINSKIDILPNETYAEFRVRINEMQAKALASGVISLLKNEVQFFKNDHRKSKLCFVAPSSIRYNAINNFKKIQSKL